MTKRLIRIDCSGNEKKGGSESLLLQNGKGIQYVILISIIKSDDDGSWRNARIFAHQGNQLIERYDMKSAFLQNSHVRFKKGWRNIVIGYVPFIRELASAVIHEYPGLIPWEKTLSKIKQGPNKGRYCALKSVKTPLCHVSL